MILALYLAIRRSLSMVSGTTLPFAKHLSCFLGRLLESNQTRASIFFKFSCGLGVSECNIRGFRSKSQFSTLQWILIRKEKVIGTSKVNLMDPENINSRGRRLSNWKCLKKSMLSEVEALNQLTTDDLEGKFAMLETSSVDDDLASLKRELSGTTKKGELPPGRTTTTNANSKAVYPFLDLEIEKEPNELKIKNQGPLGFLK